jgi:hypothetical protein
MENRWWENYAVRYFVGTVVGSVAIALLNTQPGSPFLGKLSLLGESKDTPYLGFGLTAALGLAFCYIASAPVLAVHAMRAHLRISAVSQSPAKTTLCLLPTLVGIPFLLGPLLPTLTAAIVGIVIGLQVGLLLLALITQGEVIDAFYRALATHRGLTNTEKDKAKNSGAEYVTSYRHLREHGNAFSILLLEGVLAIALFQSGSLPNAGCILLLWSLPAASSWLLATMLESRFVTTALP